MCTNLQHRKTGPCLEIESKGRTGITTESHEKPVCSGSHVSCITVKRLSSELYTYLYVLSGSGSLSDGNVSHLAAGRAGSVRHQ